jgi:hypothetical protein
MLERRASAARRRSDPKPMVAAVLLSSGMLLYPFSLDVSLISFCGYNRGTCRRRRGRAVPRRDAPDKVGDPV